MRRRIEAKADAKAAEDKRIADANREVKTVNFTADQLVDKYNNSRGAQDFKLTSSYDPKTNTFIEDVSAFGFEGDAATKTYTPEEFIAKLGYKGDDYNQFNFSQPQQEVKTVDFTADQLVDKYNNSRGAQDFNLNATYDPATNTFIEDVSAFGFEGDAATKTYTPEEFIAKLGYKGDDYNHL